VTWWGLLGGALLLMLLDTVVSDKNAEGEVQGGFGTLANLAGSFISPAKPGIPDRRGTTSSTSSTPTPVVPPVWDQLGKSPATTDRSPGTEGVGKGG
jgi:hypothetical protein